MNGIIAKTMISDNAEDDQAERFN